MSKEDLIELQGVVTEVLAVHGIERVKRQCFLHLILRVLPLASLAQHQRVAAKAMEILAGPRGSAFVSALILCSIFGALNGNILGGARVCFAMARDGLFFSSVGRVHPRFQTPATALLIQGAWAMGLAARHRQSPAARTPRPMLLRLMISSPP